MLTTVPVPRAAPGLKRAHFRGVFQEAGAVQLFDHETGRYHAFHVS